VAELGGLKGEVEEESEMVSAHGVDDEASAGSWVALQDLLAAVRQIQ